MIGNKPNPITTHFSGFPSALYLYVDIFDADFPPIDTDDHLGALRLDGFTVSSYPSPGVVERLGEVSSIYAPKELSVRGKLKSGSATLKISVWAQCPDGRFGPTCEAICVPQHLSGNGHYGCDVTSGKRICIPGWHGDDCDLVDLCATRKPCGSMGRCVNTEGGFLCQCREPFTGLLCTDNPHPCPKREWPFTEDHLTPYCHNGGTCVLRDGDRRCDCPPGFVGVRCQYDVDECTHWPSLYNTNMAIDPVKCYTPGHTASPCCGPDASCLNTWGGYKCICPTGWSGLHCEFPPVIWPNGYEPLVNATVDYGFLADRANNEAFSHLKSANLSSTHYGHEHVWVIAFSVVFVLLLILLIGIVTFYTVHMKRKRRLDIDRGSTRLPVFYTRANSAKSFHSSGNHLQDLPLPSTPKSTVYIRAPPKSTEHANANSHYRSPPDGSSKMIYEDACSASNTTYDFLYGDGDDYDAIFETGQQEEHVATTLPARSCPQSSS
ncbi:unnamed protein product [Dicrocoelium dendriticum]|nr:unnamed protein product [Dicrocoelium dendriticum]